MKSFASLIVLTLSLVVTSAADGGIITLTPVIDGTRLFYDEPGTSDVENIDTSATTLRSYRQDVSLSFGTYYEQWSFAMEFKLSSIPTNELVTSAILRFNEVQDSPGTPNQHLLFANVGDGALTLADFTPSSSQIGTVNNFIVGQSNHLVTSSIVSRLAHGDEYGSFAVIFGNGEVTTSPQQTFTVNEDYRIYSRLAGVNAPQLIVTTVSVPETSGVILVGIAVLAMACRVRRLV